MKLPSAFLAALALAAGFAIAQQQPVAPVQTVPDMPPVVDPNNLYSETAAGKLSPVVAKHLQRVYVPNRQGNDVWVIDPQTMRVVDKFPVGIHPQHVVPSWDLKTLWVANNAEGRTDGSLTPIDPATGKPGQSIAVDDPYNMYFTPDGAYAIIVAEARKRLDFRDPRTMALQFSIDVPQCAGVNHADFSIDGRYAIFTCEFAGTLAKIDLVARRVVGYLKLALPQRRFKETQSVPGTVWEPGETELCTATKGMPQDIRIAPDGKKFYIADMHADGVHIVDGERFERIGFIAIGVGTHGLYPSRDGSKLYVVNRGTHSVSGRPSANGSVTVIDFATDKIVARWGIPGGGSPDMGNLSADGNTLWLSARFDDLVYAFDTATGAVRTVRVGREPHGLAVWPQPGRYSLGHTGNLR